MYEWLEIQWNRFNIWLDAKNKNPGCQVWVRYKGNGEYGVTTARTLRTEAEREAEKVKCKAEKERRERLKEFMTEEQRKSVEAEEQHRQDRLNKKRVIE